MARFYGEIGFLRTVEKDPVNRPGIYVEVLTKRKYSGDVFSNNRRWDQSGYLNDNLVINNRISIVADSFAKKNIGAMKYVRWQGIDWKITNAELQYPRIILTIGGEYHEPEQTHTVASEIGTITWQQKCILSAANYRRLYRYTLIYITKDPDDPKRDEIDDLQYYAFDRPIVKDNLYHFYYTIYK